ncbi:hypothetical protein POM88_010027 [Heracleum sosnowskyi]|uniref:Uncharacterized protein n=1 Tax=Heracleum sosnowskyi TaxID=360622 RepID=A0AAD8J9W1_9APIA|nr:hypothetical protein POM88_010027 [Heracleum sosnowskyi]
MASTSHDIVLQQPSFCSTYIKQTRQWAAWTRQEEERFFTALRQVGKVVVTGEELHLKPRRFKMFLDALEHQLLKDRRKNIRKRHSQGEVCSTLLSQGKALMNDIHTVNVVILDSQNIQKGLGKGSLLNRNANLGVNCSNCKGDLVPLKAVRQRRKPAACKRWEKAAIAGVSLVADAAEHLERTALDEISEQGKGEKCVDPVGNVTSSSATLL